MEANKNVKAISEAIGITKRKVINQALEYLQLLKIKTNFKTKNEQPRIMICLDICATKANRTINLDKGLKLIKYGKVKYRNEKNTILRILDLDPSLDQAPNIKIICIALAYPQDVEKNATQILQKLKKCKSNLLGEIRHPQNACMAVYQSCKSLKVRVNEKKLINLSRLQRNEWTQLKTLWCPWLKELAAKQNAKNASNAKKSGQQVHPLITIKPVPNYVQWMKRIMDNIYDVAFGLSQKKGRRFGRSAKSMNKFL